VNISLTKASGEESVKGLNEIKIGIGGAFGYLIMMFIIIYGNMVMRSVIEEKPANSRNHNFLSETISIDDGKIIGTSSRIVATYLGNNWNVLLLQLRHFLSKCILQPEFHQK
jgi:hypothetical protein